MFKQIIVAMVGAIAAQMTAATLDFSPAGKHDQFRAAGRPALAVVTGAPQDFFAMPVRWLRSPRSSARRRSRNATRE